MTVEVFPSSNLAFLSLHLDSPWSFYQFLHWLMACLGNSFACSQSLCFTNQDWNLDVTRRISNLKQVVCLWCEVQCCGIFSNTCYLQPSQPMGRSRHLSIWTSLTQISSWKVSRASRELRRWRWCKGRNPIVKGTLPEDWKIGWLAQFERCL